MASQVTKNGVNGMTVDELKVYDRQLRLWGFEGQNKLKVAKVLLIGMQGLGAEIAKNLILIGINSIVLKDHTDVSILDRCSQFLIPHNSTERNRAKASLSAAQKLNPNVKVKADTKPIEEEDSSFVTKFDLVIATECLPNIYKKISEDCRNAKVKLFIADVYGMFGYFFQDVDFKHSLFGEVFPNDQNSIQVFNVKNGGSPLPFYLTSALLRFQCELNRKPNPDTSEEDITELKSIITFKDNAIDMIDILDKYYSELFCEIIAATSIVGATLSQTAVNTLMDKPIADYNVFFYDHIEHVGKFYLF